MFAKPIISIVLLAILLGVPFSFNPASANAPLRATCLLVLGIGVGQLEPWSPIFESPPGLKYSSRSSSDTALAFALEEGVRDHARWLELVSGRAEEVFGSEEAWRAFVRIYDQEFAAQGWIATPGDQVREGYWIRVDRELHRIEWRTDGGFLRVWGEVVVKTDSGSKYVTVYRIETDLVDPEAFELE